MRILIVEDEPLVAGRLERLCREILGDRLERVRVTATFEDAELRVRESPFDVVLLDLNLSGADGMDLVRNSAAGASFTIIVSANIDRALEAFEVGVLDFVPKPISRERLAEALSRVDANRAVRPASFLAVRKLGRIELVALDDLLFARGAGPYSELVLRDGRSELHDKSLEKLGAVLPPVFERIHKSYLVRLDAIAALHASEGSKYEAELKNGTLLPVGRSRFKELKARLL